MSRSGEQTRQALDVAQEHIKELQRRNNELLRQMEKVRADHRQGWTRQRTWSALTAI